MSSEGINEPELPRVISSNVLSIILVIIQRFPCGPAVSTAFPMMLLNTLEYLESSMKIAIFFSISVLIEKSTSSLNSKMVFRQELVKDLKFVGSDFGLESAPTSMTSLIIPLTLVTALEIEGIFDIKISFASLSFFVSRTIFVKASSIVKGFLTSCASICARLCYRFRFFRSISQ